MPWTLSMRSVSAGGSDTDGGGASMTVTACIVVTCRGGRVLIVDDEVFTRKTIKIKPWKIKLFLSG